MPDGILKHPRAELRAAARAMNSMRHAKSLDEFEAEWRTFLACLEKAWTKLERSCQSVRNRFEPWQGEYHRLRKKDMLLRYLKNARDADNHSIQEVTKIEPASRNIRFASPHGGQIKHLEIHGDKIEAYEGDPLIMEDLPPRLIAVPVKNHGEWFNPPTSHLGKPVSSGHPVALAELGLQFYGELVDEAEQRFFKTEPRTPIKTPPT